jgi:16S rRNA (uracil1498-N3)-methyltransferase
MIARVAERFYINCPLGLGPVHLTGPEAHHLATVCRMRPGDSVWLFNGDGKEYATEVRTVARREINLEVLRIEEPARELPFLLEVAAPLPRGDRASFLLEKLTELGVTRFVPLRTQRSVVHPRETRRDKLQRTVTEASKQCGRNVLLHVATLVDWGEYCQGEDLPKVRMLAHPGSAARIAPLEEVRASGGAAIAVGPEGGFTAQEVQWAQDSGWRLVGLGPRILRVETAALVLASLVTFDIVERNSFRSHS